MPRAAPPLAACTGLISDFVLSDAPPELTGIINVRVRNFYMSVFFRNFAEQLEDLTQIKNINKSSNFVIHLSFQ